MPGRLAQHLAKKLIDWQKDDSGHYLGGDWHIFASTPSTSSTFQCPQSLNKLLMNPQRLVFIQFFLVGMIDRD